MHVWCISWFGVYRGLYWNNLELLIEPFKKHNTYMYIYAYLNLSSPLSPPPLSHASVVVSPNMRAWSHKLPHALRVPSRPALPAALCRLFSASKPPSVRKQRASIAFGVYIVLVCLVLGVMEGWGAVDAAFFVAATLTTVRTFTIPGKLHR